MIELEEKRGGSRVFSPGSGLHEAAGRPVLFASADPRRWNANLLDELNRSVVRGRLARGLAGVSWIHLAVFTACQFIYDPAIHRDLRHLALWVLELGAVLVFLRKTLGNDWMRSSTAMNLVAKLWTTFLLLSFNLLTLNQLTGYELSWYKPVLATLSTFFFASLAWLFSPWFVVPAIQMWATGLLMVKLIDWAFLIFGLSWWVALTGTALWIRRADQTRQEDESIRQTGWGEEASICDLA
jgi:hypothetical protein